MLQAPGQPIECITRPGDVIFVPRGWWHTVMNLEDCIAITQNYVSRRNLAAVLQFFADKPEQVSGLHRGHAPVDVLEATLRRQFEAAYPGQLDALLEKHRSGHGGGGGACGAGNGTGASADGEAAAPSAASKWATMVQSGDRSFKFNFG